MAENGLRIQRLLRLIEELQGGVPRNARELSIRLGVSRRTIFRDLAVLQESHVLVQYDASKQGYWLPPRTLLPPAELSLDEALALLVLCFRLGDGGDGIPFQSAAREAALKLTSVLPRHLADYLPRATEGIEVQLDPRNPTPGTQSIYEQLLRAVVQRRSVRISYDSLTPSETIETRLSPYRVLFSRRSWYVIGRSSVHRAVRTFNLSRIRSLVELDDRYTIPPRFSLQRYLGNAWQLIREEPFNCRVRIRFQPLVARNVAEVRWHRTQQLTINSDGTLDFEVTVDGLSEISWWILGYGDQAEVLEPPELRHLLAQRIQRMAARYNA